MQVILVDTGGSLPWKDGYTQGHVERNMMTFYFVYPKPSTFVPDTEKCPSSWLIHLSYGTKKSLKNKEKRLDYIGRWLKHTIITIGIA